MDGQTTLTCRAMQVRSVSSPLRCHQSRLEKRSGVDGSPADCWMEDWRAESVAAGTRALVQGEDVSGHEHYAPTRG